MLQEVALAENVSALGVRVLLEKEWRPGQRVPVSSLRHSLIILLVAVILCLPCLLVGIPEGYDSTTHAMYQYHFSRQFWSGDLYPRWLANANKGYGSPIFLIQYPLPYLITALLRPVTSFLPTATRGSRELGVYCFLVLAAAGLAARVWFRNRCTPIASTAAAVAYISLPYMLAQALYLRVALGELSAFVWMPLALALCDRVHPIRFAVLSAIGVVFALLLLTNVLYAVLFAPLMVSYAIVSGRDGNRSFVKPVASVLLAVAIGIGVAAAYVFPLVAYQRLFDVNAMPANLPYFELGRSFLFVSLSHISHNRIAIPGIVSAICLTLIVARSVWHADVGFVNRLVMLLTLGLGIVMIMPGLGPRLIESSGLKISGFDTPGGHSMRMLFVALFTLALGLLAYCRISEEYIDRRDRLLLVVACSAFVLMLPWSAPIWKAIPELAIIQFPWRLCAILNVAVAGLFAAAMDNCLRHWVRDERRPSLIVMGSVVLAVIAGGSLICRIDLQLRTLGAPRVDVTRGVDLMYRTYVPPSRLAGFAKILGTSPESYDVAPTPVEDVVRAEFTDGRGVVNLVRVGPRKLRVSAQCSEDARVRITQLYSPLWRVVQRIPSLDHPVLDSSPDGLIQVSLGAGQHDFELVFAGGWPERWGLIVTLASILIAVSGFAFGGLWGRTRKPNVNEQHAPS
jgi:hypothetical protein